MITDNNTICAISSPAGVGAVSIIRLTGSESFDIAKKIIKTKKSFDKIPPRMMNYSVIIDEDGYLIDNVLFTKFTAPHSFSGENMLEIYCHGSPFIQKKIIELLCKSGASIAKPGEFTKRAFLNGKMDLSQSEAVADIIASSSKESHRLAINQMKGGVSDEINMYRDVLIELVSLMELELDFAEEDVEFADRKLIEDTIDSLLEKASALIDSFKYGKAIKSGVPVVIAGKPNVGKSSLLNKLLQEDKAIVTEIPGTTRDVIEDEIMISGISFRFIDTAGIRESGDEIESIGIKKTFEKLSVSLIIILMLDINDDERANKNIISAVREKVRDDQHIIIVQNKIDKKRKIEIQSKCENLPQIGISAKENTNIDFLKNALVDIVKLLKTDDQNVIITSARHEQSLISCKESLIKAKEALKNKVSTEFVSQDIRQAVYYLGEITGEISNEEVLGRIFEKFCIGK